MRVVTRVFFARRLIVAGALCGVFLACRAHADEPAGKSILALETVVLRVHVTSVEDTGFYPVDHNCKEEEGQICLRLSSYLRYHAKIKQVTRGAWNGTKEVDFIRLQHGTYVPKFIDDCYVELTRLGPNLAGQMKVQYGGMRMASPNTSKPETIKALIDGQP